MFGDYQDHFEWRGAALLQGRYDDLAQHYRIPFCADLAGHVVHVETADDLVLALHRHRVALSSLGVTRLLPRILAVRLPGPGHAVWVEWRAEGADRPLRAQAQYHLERVNGWRRITAMAYTTLMIPEFAQPSWHRRLSRSRG